MRKFLFAIFLCSFVVSGFAASRTGPTPRQVTSPRQVASQGQLAMGSMASMKVIATPVPQATPQPAIDNPAPAPTTNNRELERTACLNNNVGMGNTFVWASRNSNIGSYATMIEDVEHPENNVCFALVKLKSEDSRIDLDDIPGKYFVMGDVIKCGSWVAEDDLKQRILDGKKKARTWATVAGSVGGAGVGVGSMELFGNDKIIKGAVSGQKGMNETDKLHSKLLVLKKEAPSNYNKYIKNVAEIKKLCEKNNWGENEPEACSELDFDAILATQTQN